MPGANVFLIQLLWEPARFIDLKRFKGNIFILCLWLL